MPDPETANPAVHLSGRLPVPLEFRRRKGTRHLKLSIGSRNQLVVSQPWNCSRRDALAFAESQAAWVAAQLSRLPPVRTVSEWLRDHPQLSARGRSWQAELRPAPKGRAAYWFEDGERLVMRVATAAGVAAVVRRLAGSELRMRTVDLGRRHGALAAGVSVRDQSSRWGSCSERGSVSLNWRLVLLPPELQDSVILHELAHLRELNHSPRFWAHLARLDPEFRRHNRQLEELGPALLRVALV